MSDIDRVLRETPIDVAFLALHGRFGEDGAIQGVLEWLGIPYTGCGVLGSAVCMDKLRTKRLAAAVGIATADVVVLRGPQDLELALAQLLVGGAGGGQRAGLADHVPGQVTALRVTPSVDPEEITQLAGEALFAAIDLPLHPREAGGAVARLFYVIHAEGAEAAAAQ